jgi:hypothetical protein
MEAYTTYRISATMPRKRPTWQGRRGQGQLGGIDQSINGCTPLAAVVVSTFLVGVCSVRFIGEIIDQFCDDPIIARIRRNAMARQ